MLDLQIEGKVANASDAIILDKDGFVSEANATNMVRTSQIVIIRVIVSPTLDNNFVNMNANI